MKVLCKCGYQLFQTIHKSNGYIILNTTFCRTHTYSKEEHYLAYGQHQDIPQITFLLTFFQEMGQLKILSDLYSQWLKTTKSMKYPWRTNQKLNSYTSNHFLWRDVTRQKDKDIDLTVW